MAVSSKEQIKQLAENDLVSFIRLVHPHRVLGSAHVELCNWWTRQEHKSHQLVLLPRDHQKSALLAYRVAQAITKNPAIRILYVSSTSLLATKQLKFIKDILTCDTYRFYWPEMVNDEESKREKWTETEISVDHPARRKETVRDPTVFAAGLTTSLTGLHFDVAALDDCVVRENAYTEEGRDKVRTMYSLLASIESAEAEEWVVGTRYFPEDLYYDLLQMHIDEYDDIGEVIASESLFELFERQVETSGDGNGQYLWPRQQRSDGKWFGFDASILAKKRAQYLDKTQFRAQYYNDPNYQGEGGLNPEFFQYYEPKFLTREQGKWFYKNTRLNVFAAIDFAYSLSKKADYTAIVVIGVDSNFNYYVLDIDRFKTGSIKEYFDHILASHQKWDFRKLRAEVTGAQQTIVTDLKENHIRSHGLALSVEDYRPTRHVGSKEERIQAALFSRYENRQIWHYRGGNCQVLEEELTQAHPTHDDVKDCLASVIEMAVAPGAGFSRAAILRTPQVINSRFGGIR